jgi:hypothetical protein
MGTEARRRAVFRILGDVTFMIASIPYGRLNSERVLAAALLLGSGRDLMPITGSG